MVAHIVPPPAPPGFTVPPQDNSYLPKGPGPTTTSDRAVSAGAVPADPKGPATLPPGSPGAAVTTKTKDGALDTAPTAQPGADTQLSVKAVLAETFAGLWLLFGLIGFIMSLICFGYSGSVGEKILGILISLALGPFYFLYYFSDAGYCKAMPPTLF